MTNTPDHTPATPDLEVEHLRAELDRYTTAYRKLIDQLEKKRIESDEGARAIEEKKVRGKDGQLIPHECAIAISGLAGGYLTATVLAINLFEGAEARTAYLQRTIPQVPEAAGHEGNDPMGAPTLHRGLLERCPAPECDDRTLEQRNDWGVYCPHGQQIVERDPDHTDPDGYPIGRLITPWPCPEDSCTLEAFEAAEQERQNDEVEAISALASDVHR